MLNLQVISKYRTPMFITSQQEFIITKKSNFCQCFKRHDDELLLKLYVSIKITIKYGKNTLKHYSLFRIGTHQVLCVQTYSNKTITLSHMVYTGSYVYFPKKHLSEIIFPQKIPGQNHIIPNAHFP